MPERTISILMSILLCLFWSLMLGVSFALPDTFGEWMREDGPVENLTVLVILFAAVVLGRRLLRLWGRRPWVWRGFMVFLLLAMVFAAGEEISWGQRLLGFETSHFFLENNTQSETNLHNLVIKGVKVNFVISQVFVWSLVAYLLVLPYLYRRREKARHWVNHCGIPVPQGYQIILMLAAIVLMAIIQHDKKWELLEASIALVGCLILIYPRNKAELYGDAPAISR